MALRKGYPLPWMVLAMSPLAMLSLALLAGVGIAALSSSSSSTDSGDTVPAPGPGPLAAIPPGASVLLLGDSIGVGIAPYLKKLVPGTFEARVLTGRSLTGGIAALHGDEGNFDVVLLSFGSNDALLDPAHYPGQLATLLHAVRNPYNRVFWIVPPGFTYGTTKSVSGANAFADAIAAEGIAPVASSPVPPAVDDPMHLHLNPKGYDAFAHAIAQGLYG